MNPKKLKETMVFAISHKLPILIKGAPGIGKSDIVEQACKEAGAKLIISHPVVSDPTDYKGLPFPSADKTHATFLPYGDMQKLIDATEETVFFLDDLGQAPMSVQAACMQLILARKINGFSISDKVTFIAATNRRQDKAGVTGILEPVKSRFAAIIELEVDDDDWVSWAMQNNMPDILITFIRFRPTMLSQFKPTADMINSPCPRTIAYVGKIIKSGCPESILHEMVAGATGDGFAAEFMAFLGMVNKLPRIEDIIAKPSEIEVPSEPALKYAISTALAMKATTANIDK